MRSSLKSAHCKERQLERGISDSEIDRAIELRTRSQRFNLDPESDDECTWVVASLR